MRESHLDPIIYVGKWPSLSLAEWIVDMQEHRAKREGRKQRSRDRYGAPSTDD